jgi:hypothetical protein
MEEEIKKSGDSSKHSTIKTIDQPEAPAFI